MNVEQKIEFVYRRFFYVHEECGNYFRHLYRILRFVSQSEEDELNDTKDDVVRQHIMNWSNLFKLRCLQENY